MGGSSSKTEEDVKLYLEKNYITEGYPRVVHRSTKKKAIVHQIVTDTKEHAELIRNDIHLYNHLHCESINNVLEYLPLETEKLCSDQEYHYIVEEDFEEYSLKEEYCARKYYKESFSAQEILAVLRTFAACLKVYHQEFHRRFHTLGMEQINIEEEKFCQIRMNDPLLARDNVHFDLQEDSTVIEPKKKLRLKKGRSSQSLFKKTPTIRQAPERTQLKRTKLNQEKIEYDELLADLYSVGIIGIELSRMQQFKEQEGRNSMESELNHIRDQRLRKSLQILTSLNPRARSEIYEYLKVNIRDYNALDRCHKRGQKGSGDIWNHNLLKAADNSDDRNYNNISFGTNNSQFVNSQKPSESFSFNAGSSYVPNSNSHVQALHLPKPSEPMLSPQQNSYSSPIKAINQNQNFGEWHQPQTYETSVPSILKTSSNYHPSNQTTFGPKLAPNTDRTYNTTNSGFDTGRSFWGTNDVSSKGFQSSSSTAGKPTAITFNNKNLGSAGYDSKFESVNYSSSGYDFSKKSTSSQPKYPLSNALKQPSKSIFLNEAKEHKSIYLQDYSPYKAQQNTSPFSQKDNSFLESNNNCQEIFDKYSHLNFESNFDPSKTDAGVKKQMDKILHEKESQVKRPVFDDTPKSPHESLTNILNEASKKQVAGFKAEGFGKEEKQIGSTYKPNKQVEEILKRLGIGSLLYGNTAEKAQDTEFDHNHTQPLFTHHSPTKESTPEATLLPTRDIDSHVEAKPNSADLKEPKVFEHALNYNVIKRSTAENESLKQEAHGTHHGHEEQSFQNISEKTPPRPIVTTNKYNSTIVEVGDDDEDSVKSPNSRDGSNSSQKKKELQLAREYVVEDYETGSRYEGYKLDGKRDGKGKFFYQDGGYYEGEWKNNKMHGWGELYYEGGKLAYEGNWAQDEFHGFGKVYNDNPKVLDQSFDFTNFDQLEDFWLYYEGMLVNDTKEGRGKIKLTNGEVFEGDFHSDRIQGFGKFTMGDGTMIEGIWRDSKLIKVISS